MMLTKNAVFSDDHTRRYRLRRSWQLALGQESRGNLGWAMLNPSTADEQRDDATVRKCIGFAKRWGFDEITIVNLIPIVSTDPWALPAWKGLFTDNDPYLRHALEECDQFVVGWGAVNRALAQKIAWAEHLFHFRKMAAGTPLYCIDHTRYGSPLHPSRAPYRDSPESFCWEFAYPEL